MVEESAGSAGSSVQIPGIRRFPGGREWHLISVFCLKNSMDRGAVGLQNPWGHKRLVTTEQPTLSLSE